MDKAAQIDQVVEDLIRRQQSGKPISHTDVARQYPELMPDLEDRLAMLRSIEAAADKAKEEPDSAGSLDGSDTAFQEDLQLLREALPGYEIAERLRHGGQGVVFRAAQLSTNRDVAIKILLDGPLVTERQKHRFAREVALIARLRHPNIVTVYDSGVIRGRQYFAMEYVDGLTLDDYLLLHGLGVRERVRLFTKVCHAVSFAHQRGIIHRDLKPSNVLVDGEGEPHILDFGLAKDYSKPPGEPGTATISMSGQVVGTLPYLSPEQARGADDEVDVRSDIYALGVMLFEMLTGGFPYPVDGENLTVRNHIVTREPMRPRKLLAEDSLDGGVSRGDVSDDLEAIVLKALEKDKSRRYQSAAAFAEDLLRYMAGDAVHAKAASTLYVLKKTMRKFRVHVSIAAVFLGLLAASAIGMGILWRAAETQRQSAEYERQKAVGLAEAYRTGLEMGALLKLGSVERDEGRLDQAIAMFEKALELGGQVVTAEPEVLRFYYDAHHRLAELYLAQTQDYAKAKPHCDAALAIANEAVEAHPDDLRWRRLSGFSYVLKGRLAYDQKDWESALKAFSEARFTFEEVMKFATDRVRVEGDLANAREWQGHSSQKLGRFDEAFEHFSEGYEIRKKHHQLQPDSLDRIILLANSELNLAAWLLCQKSVEKDEEAVSWLQRAEDRLTGVGASAQASTRSWDIQRILHNIGQNKEILRSRAERRAAKRD